MPSGLPITKIPRRATSISRCMLGVAFAWIAAMPWVHAQSSPPTTSTAEREELPEPLVGWAALPTSRPLQLSIEHSVEYRPAAYTIRVAHSNWRIDQLAIDSFGGQLLVQGRGNVGSQLPADLTTTLTLNAVDIQRVLQFLAVPQASQIRGKLEGTAGIQILAGDWHRVDLDLRTLPNTVYLHRRLIKQLLGSTIGGGLTGAQIDQTLNHHFGPVAMIPFSPMSIRGKLGEHKVQISVPLRNEALSIDFEPLVDRKLLWDLWQFLKNSGLKDVKDIDWGLAE